MSANNFLADNPKAKPISRERDDQPVVKWTEPVLDDKKSAAKNADSFFDMLKSTDEKRQVSADSDDFGDKKKILHEYDSAISEEKNKKNMPEKKIKNIDRPWTLKTNLIKEEVTTFVNWRKNIIYSLLGLIFVVLTLGGAYSSLVYKEYKAVKEEKELSAEIADIQNQIDQAKKMIIEADEFQKKLVITTGLLDNHIYWSEFFKFIEDNTLANTFYNGTFAGDIKSSFKLQATTNSYQDVDDQLRIFKANKQVLDAKISGASFDDKESGVGGKISYDLELSLSPDIFKKNK